MTKTTIYLDESWLRDLRRLSGTGGRAGVATLIRQAVAEFLTKSKVRKSKSHFKRILEEPPRKRSSFGEDPVAYQKRIRREWDR